MIPVSNLRVTSVIGIDPGPSTGISFLDYVGNDLAGSMQVQVDGQSAAPLLEAVLATWYSNSEVVTGRFAQIESFVTSQSAGSKGDDADVTRQLVTALGEKLQVWGYTVFRRKKADIYKKDGTGWASDKRLQAAGILRPPENRHANDASRHGLYCAVHDVYKPDPLR